MSTLIHSVLPDCVTLQTLRAPCGCHVEVWSGWIHMPCHARPGLSSLAEGVNSRARTRASTRCTYCQDSPCLWPPQSGGVPALLGSGAGMECSSRPVASLSGDLHTQHALAPLADRVLFKIRFRAAARCTCSLFVWPPQIVMRLTFWAQGQTGNALHAQQRPCQLTCIPLQLKSGKLLFAGFCAPPMYIIWQMRTAHHMGNDLPCLTCTGIEKPRSSKLGIMQW